MKHRFRGILPVLAADLTRPTFCVVITRIREL